MESTQEALQKKETILDGRMGYLRSAKLTAVEKLELERRKVLADFSISQKKLDTLFDGALLKQKLLLDSAINARIIFLQRG